MATYTGTGAAESLYGSGVADSIDGLGGNDYLVGYAGDDTFEWRYADRGGTDTMVGGIGDDTYVVDLSGTDVVIEYVGEGTHDTIWAETSYSLALLPYVEDLVLFGAADADGTGNDVSNLVLGNDGDNWLSGGAGNDLLDGNAGDDTLEGGDGDDILDGGAGYDYVDYGLASDGVMVNLGFVGFYYTIGSGSDEWTSIEGVLGSAYGDVITGNDGDNIFVGRGGNDLLDGAGGVDAVFYGFAAGGVTVSLEAGGDDGDGGFDVLFNIEQIAGSAFADSLTGDEGANYLYGLGGNDSLTGRDAFLSGAATGVDTLEGGAGDDTYDVVAAEGTVVTELAAEGYDAIWSLGTYSIAALPNIEKLGLLDGTSASATGNGRANWLEGNSNANTLSGANGADKLYGNAGNDSLNGGGGNDQLSGGLGVDTLIGGAGKDQFRFDISPVGAGKDTIKYFSHAQADKIVLDKDFFAVGAAGTALGGKFFSASDLTATGGGAGMNSSDRILYDTDSGNLYYDSNGSLAGGRVLFATLAAHPELLSTDFLIVT